MQLLPAPPYPLVTRLFDNFLMTHASISNIQAQRCLKRLYHPDSDILIYRGRSGERVEEF